ncbi:MAG: 23S rRNA (adenine(2503)-C(2))-methyltransferase RlmN [Kiritimatiellia bacterium]
MSEKRDMVGMSREEMKTAVRELGLPAFRADQVWRWVQVQMAADWSRMTNLGPALQQQLGSFFEISPTHAAEVKQDVSGTIKLLLRLADNECIETVLIPAEDRRTVCVSSQAGCRYNCAFCASGKGGYHRDLQAGEIVDQVRQAARYWKERVSNVVFMGIGEPFDNYDAVLKAVRLLNDPDGMGIGARRLTISTAGVIPGIQRLAGEGIQVELSVSLHAADDERRSQLMPINRKYPLPELLAACAAYTRDTKRIITFEYTLIRDVNDSPDQAHALARLLKPFPCRVNLIPLSPVPEYPHVGPLPETLDLFLDILNRNGINATCRFSRGKGVNAACGQLRLGTLREKETT